MSFSFQQLLYNGSLFFFKIGAWLAAPFNPKARSFTQGQRNLLKRISSQLRDNEKPIAWFHCASLGEFEQGRPVMEAFKNEYSNFDILLTFFSPSGYEIRKDYPGADYVFYLPLDRKGTARKFIELCQPAIVFFVKYEFWYHYLTQLRNQGVPVLLISALFRKDQVFFKWYGGFYREMLTCFKHIFVQNKKSADLLKGIGLSAVSIAGDTRVDRVKSMADSAPSIGMVNDFKGDYPLMVIGSCWPEDAQCLIPFINCHTELKFVIAPHEISPSFLQQLETKINRKTFRYSQKDTIVADYEVLIVDTVGLLSTLYQYGDYAFVGGAFGKGLHNILEAVTFGVPVFFGSNNYQKFQEAVDLIGAGGAFPVKNYAQLEEKFEFLKAGGQYQKAANISKSYVHQQIGATDFIMHYCHGILNTHEGKGI